MSFNSAPITFIADVIANMPAHAPSLRAQRISTANAFADALAKQFSGLDRAEFLRACKLNKGMPE